MSRARLHYGQKLLQKQQFLSKLLPSIKAQQPIKSTKQEQLFPLFATAFTHGVFMNDVIKHQRMI